MTRVRACLLLVCCLIASRPALAAPGAALPLLPSGEVTDTTIAFSWQAAPESTWYLFWLSKATSTVYEPALVMEQWYTAEQAGCANGGVCTVTLTPLIGAGSHFWYVQTWGGGAAGPWSTGKMFVMRNPTPGWSAVLPDARRFTLVMNNQAVLDNETGLVWQRTPSVTLSEWNTHSCTGVSLNGRFGWRQPTIAELSSLLDGDYPTAGLPAGHPFNLGAGSSEFWTATSVNATFARVVRIGYGVGSGDKSSETKRFWCVRGAGGATQ